MHKFNLKATIRQLKPHKKIAKATHPLMIEGS